MPQKALIRPDKQDTYVNETVFSKDQKIISIALKRFSVSIEVD